MIGLRWTRSNQLALIVLVLASGGSAALLWSPKALTQVSTLPMYPTPIALPRPVDQPDAPARISRFSPPTPDRIPLPARFDEAESIPIPTPREQDGVWVRDRRVQAPSCELDCQYTMNDGLQNCPGSVDLEALKAAGRPLPPPDCHSRLYKVLQACMKRCGVDLPDLVRSRVQEPAP